MKKKEKLPFRFLALVFFVVATSAFIDLTAVFCEDRERFDSETNFKVSKQNQKFNIIQKNYRDDCS